LCVWIPLEAWMFSACMRLFCVYVVLCLGRDLATRYHLSREFYRLRKMITEPNKRLGFWMGWKSYWKKKYVYDCEAWSRKIRDGNRSKGLKTGWWEGIFKHNKKKVRGGVKDSAVRSTAFRQIRFITAIKLRGMKLAEHEWRMVKMKRACNSLMENYERTRLFGET
jgi:hypothetical protein